MPESSLGDINPNTPSCIFHELYNLLEKRKEEGQVHHSYTANLMEKGLDAVLKKIGEESTELVIAAKNRDHQEQVHEIADLCYHLLVLMVYHNISLDDIHTELQRRLNVSGIEEKKSRAKN